MSYQVWTKDEFEGWKMKECESIGEAQTEILLALKRGADPLLTVEVPFDVNIKIKEVKEGEVPKIKTKPDKGPGAESKGQVRPGDTSPVPKLG